MLRIAISRIVLLLVGLAIWEVLARTVINPFWISQPSAILMRLAELGESFELLDHVRVTVMEAAAGLALGFAVGVPGGILLHAHRNAAAALDPYIMGIYSLPRVALAPLFILWFGIGFFSKVMMAFSLVVFVFLLNTADGLKTIDRDLVDLMRTMRAPRGYVVRKVLAPAILPWVIAAFRIGIGLALIGAVVGELIGANRGLGWYITYSAGQFDTTGVFAGLVALMIVAMLANTLVKLIEARALAWRGAA